MQDRERNDVASRQARIRDLNDRLRTTGQGGRTLVTMGVRALPPETFARAITAIRKFANFTPGNDPYGEHDFGQVTVDDDAIFFKVDYYDINLEFGSPDPADETVTCRVMTIMTAGEL